MTITYVRWANPDTLWHLAARWLAQAGYADTPTMATAIRQANPTILDWKNVADGTRIALPFL